MSQTGLYRFSQDSIALAAATVKSVLELSPGAADRCTIKEWWVDFDGVSASAVPVKVEEGRFSSAVTTATTGTAGKVDAGDGTAACTVKHSTSTEGAGTADASVIVHRISPTTGYHYIAPMGQEIILPLSGFWRLRLTAAAVVNVTVGVVWEE